MPTPPYRRPLLRMNILFLTRQFFPHIGGVETHVWEIATRLIKRGHEVTVVSERDCYEYQSLKRSARMAGINDFGSLTRQRYRKKSEKNRKESRKKKWYIWWWLFRNRKLIERSDLIHCHDVFFWYLPFRFLYPRKPVYTTFHGYETRFPPPKKAILIRKLSELLSWRNICVGDYISKWYGTKPIYVTYGGVEIIPINTNTTNKYQSKNKKLKILFIGRLEEDTGLLIYLKTLELLKIKKISFEFEACGDGSLRGEVEQYGMVYGFVKNLDSYINKADLVFSSSYLSILQSLLNKRLVIAAYNNPLKEDYLKMAPFAKWIVIENSPEKLVRKIKYFIRHLEDRMRFVNKAHEWVKDQTWDNVVKLYIRLWKL